MPDEIGQPVLAKAITVASSEVVGTHADYPLYVDVSGDPDLLEHSTGDDVVFTDDEGNVLSHQRIEHTPKVEKDAVWHWHSSPQAVHYNGKTYVSWMTEDGSNWIGAYDHDTGEWKKGKVLDGPSTTAEPDDHNYATILIRDDGHVMAFWSARSYPVPQVRISSNPEDISSWGDRIDITTDDSVWYRYTHPHQFPDGTIWVHSRVDWIPTAYTSTDGGQTWSDPTQLVVPEEAASDVHRPYTKIYAEDNSVHCSFTDGHPRGIAHENSMYYMRYDHLDQAYYKADGTKIGNVGEEPFFIAELDLVYDASGETQNDNPSAWNWDVAADESGNPMILMVTWPWRDGYRSYLDHVYHRAKWTGSTWEIQEITNSGSGLAEMFESVYSKGIRFDHEDPDHVYLAKDDEDGYTQIYHYETTDGGATWQEVEQLSSGKMQSFRPYVPRNSHPDLKCIWLDGDYAHFLPPRYKCGMVFSNGYAEYLSARYFVLVPEVSDRADTTIYLHYGGDPYPESDLWSDHVFAGAGHHLKYNGGAVPFGSLSAFTIEIGGVQFEDPPPRSDTKTPYPLLSTWYDGDDGVLIQRQAAGDGNEIEVYVNTPDGVVGGAFTGTGVTLNQPFRLDVIWDGTELKVRFDGIESATTYALDNISDAGHDMWIGQSAHPVQTDDLSMDSAFGGTTWKGWLRHVLHLFQSNDLSADAVRGGATWNGWLRHVRISDSVRSVGYLETTHKAEAGTLYTIADETDPPLP